MRRPRDPHLAIVWAACNDKGLTLTVEEVLTLAADEAILKAAEGGVNSDTAWCMMEASSRADWSREERLFAAYAIQQRLRRAQTKKTPRAEAPGA